MCMVRMYVVGMVRMYVVGMVRMYVVGSMCMSGVRTRVRVYENAVRCMHVGYIIHRCMHVGYIIHRCIIYLKAFFDPRKHSSHKTEEVEDFDQFLDSVTQQGSSIASAKGMGMEGREGVKGLSTSDCGKWLVSGKQ